MSRLSFIIVVAAVAACSTPRFTHPAVVPTTDERVALGFPRDVLYVLDGHVLPRGDSTSVPTAVRDLDPSTIDTIQVLKGASAKRAYGDAGASGVVIIKTKSAARRGGA
ncbi:MAG TPA: TonB-dependent receptor plug domain-containing protein [Gemmatimonadaceae bacterium]|nr:TonB-dependent receptor plug domain-containing protein [Gemmatimonadaceae bacterium]